MNVAVVLGVPVLAIAGFVAYRFVVFQSLSRRHAQRRIDRLKPLEEKLTAGQATAADVLPFAQNLLTREPAFCLLEDHRREDLFPAEYLTIVKAAESNLANWLEFPTELGICPDEMEHIKRVTIDEAHYEVFKYRTHAPHWAAKAGWMLGVAGPYSDDSKPYDFPPATFSRCNSTVDQVKPEDEAKWVHEHIFSRRR